MQNNIKEIMKAEIKKESLKIVFNKVPEITISFWIIKILCTTVGETFADFLNTNFNFGLSGTSVAVSLLLAVVLFFEFRLRTYIPSIYWLAVVLLSIVGTLITDNLTDNFGVSLITATSVFAVILILVFISWYKSEKTLSIHSIYTKKRESFYWLAILFTFALGTAAGDLLAERFSLGYLLSAIIFAACISVVYFAYKKLKLNAVLAFWIAYILTRPLGASIGDFLSQDKSAGGIGLGTTTTSIIFLFLILSLVIYLTKYRKISNSNS